MTPLDLIEKFWPSSFGERCASLREIEEALRSAGGLTAAELLERTAKQWGAIG